MIIYIFFLMGFYSIFFMYNIILWQFLNNICTCECTLSRSSFTGVKNVKSIILVLSWLLADALVSKVHVTLTVIMIMIMFCVTSVTSTRAFQRKWVAWKKERKQSAGLSNASSHHLESSHTLIRINTVGEALVWLNSCTT